MIFFYHDRKSLFLVMIAVLLLLAAIETTRGDDSFSNTATKSAKTKSIKSLMKTNKSLKSFNSSMPTHSVTMLYQDDFDQGTYRITQSGHYKLGQDIYFGPQKSNDYWPPFHLYHTYPPTAYYLGFFAAITIEADDVTIDLGGFILQQTDEFYLTQRFFNAIELNDRVFIPNKGVSSLNYQSSDRLIHGEKLAGSIIKPSNVIIRNGVIGKSSHSGIHGNGVIGLRISNVHIHDFEVSGIHCNGCKNVEISDSKVGPSMNKVPVLATFSNARFLDFFTKTLIPYGFSNDPTFKEPLMEIFDENISFADRSESQSLHTVFDRLSKALSLFRSYLMNSTVPADDNDKALLQDARKIFENPTGLPDGSAVYGIILNRLGFPETNGKRQSEGIMINNVEISNLHANPIEIPALMTEENVFMQGPARDLIRIYDITSDQMRSLGASYYKGNFLSDAYVALWKMSNEFFKIRVFDSDCGNFGSNATFPMNLKLFPSNSKQTCAEAGIKNDANLSGRDAAMLQKRYFGGLQMSQGFYKWATTSKMGLDTLLSSPSSADILRSGGRHRLVCDHDTMFHPMHGIVGLKIVEANKVKVSNVQIHSMNNTADFRTWVCGHKWQNQPSGEDIIPISSSTSPPQSSMVRGVEIIRSNNVDIESTSIRYLTSDEGTANGIDMRGDDNARTDQIVDKGVQFNDVSIGHLSGAVATNPIVLVSTSTPLGTSGITYEGSSHEIDASIKNQRVVLNYQAVNTGPPIPVNSSQVSPIEMLKLTTNLDTDTKILSFRNEVLQFFSSQYGIQFEDDVSEKYGIEDLIPALDKDGSPTDSFVSFLSMLDGNTFMYHGSSLCVSDAGSRSSICTNHVKAPVHDFSITFVVGQSGYTFHGVFGSNQGQFSPPGNYIACGIYSFEGMHIPGREKKSNVMIKYFGECPIDLRPIRSQGLQSMYINCALESELFGKGIATGMILYDFLNPLTVVDGISVPRVSAYPMMIFDDFVPHPTPIVKETYFQSGMKPYMQSNDIRFSFVADGSYKSRIAAIEALPYPTIHHHTHDAALEYFKCRTSLKSDEDIFNLRKDFLVRLKEDFAIGSIGDVDDYDSIPLDGVIDLGGGNTIVGYTVNQDGNQRVLTVQRSVNEPTAAMPGGSRLHEGGFRLVVGRSGIDTIDGRSPFGTTIMQGIYILENGNPDGTHAEINFHSIGLVDLNSWSTSVVYHYLYHDVYGEGRLFAAQPMPKMDEAGIHLKISGSLVFGNVN